MLWVGRNKTARGIVSPSAPVKRLEREGKIHNETQSEGDKRGVQAGIRSVNNVRRRSECKPRTTESNDLIQPEGFCIKVYSYLIGTPCPHMSSYKTGNFSTTFITQNVQHFNVKLLLFLKHSLHSCILQSLAHCAVLFPFVCLFWILASQLLAS